MCNMIEQVQLHFEEWAAAGDVCRIYLRRIMHTYYKVTLAIRRFFLKCNGSLRRRTRRETTKVVN